MVAVPQDAGSEVGTGEFVSPKLPKAPPFRARPTVDPLPKEEEAGLAEARRLLAKGQAAKAIEGYAVLTQTDVVKAELGYATLLSGDRDGALTILDGVVSASEALLAQVHFNRGLAHEGLGHVIEARLAFALSYGLAPTTPAWRKLSKAPCVGADFTVVTLPMKDYPSLVAVADARLAGAKATSEVAARTAICDSPNHPFGCQACEITPTTPRPCAAEGPWIVTRDSHGFLVVPGTTVVRVLDGDASPRFLDRMRLQRAKGGPRIVDEPADVAALDVVLVTWQTPDFELLPGSEGTGYDAYFGLGAVIETTAVVDVARGVILVSLSHRFEYDSPKADHVLRDKKCGEPR